MYPEDDLLPISALQHLLFCPRQCALIHVERLWAENSLTREGRHLHEKADAGKGESRKRSVGKLRIARGLMLRSLQLGLYGKADVVEFISGAAVSAVEGPATSPVERPAPTMIDGAPTGPQAAPNFPPAPALPALSKVEGSAVEGAIPFPVEYKRGKPKKNRCDEVQLCAQALCLEEMLASPVPAGALFYGKTRRRVDVAFDATLRALTLKLIGELREMIDSGRTPPAVREKKCERCSLLHLCLPEARPGTDAASRYLRRSLKLALSGVPSGD